MKKLKEFSNNEKLLLAMLIISIVLVAFSWGRISTGAKKVFNFYTGTPVENKK